MTYQELLLQYGNSTTDEVLPAHETEPFLLPVVPYINQHPFQGPRTNISAAIDVLLAQGQTLSWR
jgi:hypothetical protein